eukprot:superscaffoldBa00001980_g12734
MAPIIPLKVYNHLHKGYNALYRQNKILCRQNQTVRRHNDALLQHNAVLRKDIQALHERLSDHYAGLCSHKDAPTNLDQGHHIEESTLCHEKMNREVRTWEAEKKTLLQDVEALKKRLEGFCRVEEEVNDPHSITELRHQVLKSQEKTDIVPCTTTKGTQGKCSSFRQNLEFWQGVEKETVHSDHRGVCHIIDKNESEREEKEARILTASKREKKLLEEVREMNQVLNTSIKEHEEEKEAMCQKMEALSSQIQELKEMLQMQKNKNEEMLFTVVEKEGKLLQELEETKEMNHVCQFLMMEIKEQEEAQRHSKDALQQETKELKKMLQIEKDKNEEMLLKMIEKEEALVQETEEAKEVTHVFQFLLQEVKEQEEAKQNKNACPPKRKRGASENA